VKTKIKKPRPNVWKNEHCPKYNPKEEGYGSVDEWVGSFRSRMGLDEANKILGNDDPRMVLGLLNRFTVTELKSAWRKYVMLWHPDRHLKDEYSQQKAEKMFKVGQAAYVKLGG
jgi:hypothetical protein